MVLESTVICVDNSEYMRNGDYLPTRLQAQQEAVTLVCRSKVRSNPENNVALITLTKGEVLVTLTNDVGRVLSRLYQVQPCGDINLNIGMKIAQLALKHRQGKNHKMRIVAFVGSPIVSEQEELIKLAKKLKKEKVNVDIVNFGEEEINTEILSDFVNILNGTDGTGSHLITVPPCPHLTEALIFSPIIQGEDGSSGVNLNNYEFGVDPNEDPELALALRISMEEQRQRQSQDSRKSKDSSPKLPNIEEMPNENDNELLEFQSMTEDEQIAFALQMSMQDFQGTQKKQDEDDDDYSEIMNDPEFLQNVLENLPGVDPQSETVRKAVDNLTEKKKEDDEKKGEKK